MSSCPGLNRPQQCLEVARRTYSVRNMQMIGCSRFPATLSRRFEDPSVGMAAPDGWSDDIKWQERRPAGPYRFRKPRDCNPRAVAGLADGIARREGKIDREPTRRDVSAVLALTPVVFAPISTSSSMWTSGLVDAEVGGLLLFHEFSVRRHTAATETTRVMATRRNVLTDSAFSIPVDRDPLFNYVRSAAALWWMYPHGWP